MSDYPSEYRYTKEHEWVALEDGVATIGITDYAQGELGDIIFVEMPEVGSAITQGEPFGTIEAVKAVEELYSPVSGKVIEVNSALEESPETVNQAPFADGWIVKVRLEAAAELEALMDSAAYLALVGA